MENFWVSKSIIMKVKRHIEKGKYLQIIYLTVYIFRIYKELSQCNTKRQWNIINAGPKIEMSCHEVCNVRERRPTLLL